MTTTNHEGFGMEAAVAVLVELFAKTRPRFLKPPSRAVLAGWRRTFGIMLGRRGIPFEDIELVVTALGDKRLWLDFARYHDPDDLIDNGEWPHVLGWVRIALLREQKMPTPPSRRWSRFDDDDDDYLPRRRGASTYRYLARAARS